MLVGDTITNEETYKRLLEFGFQCGYHEGHTRFGMASRTWFHNSGIPGSDPQQAVS